MKGRIFVSLFLLVILFGCKKNNSPTESESPTQPGTTKEYTVNATSSTIVKDDITGLTFQFPQGGNGKLTIIEMIDAPAFSITSKKFSVNFTGSTQVQLIVPSTQTESGLLLHYGTITKASVNGENKSTGWWQVPEYIQSGDQLIYNLTLQNSVSKQNGNYAVPANTYAYASINSNSTEAEKLTAIKTSVSQIIDTWINSMPSDMATSIRSKVNGSFKYNINVSSDGSSYLAGNSSIFRNCNFYFKLATVETRTIAHEVGHYISHVMLGYDKYMEIYSKFPSDWIGAQISHSPGDNIGRSAGTIEDYAYFSEYLITGAVDVGYDFSSVKRINSFADVTNNSLPKNIDYPGSEGFSAAILISLLRNSSPIYCFDKSWGQTAVPVVNAPIQDVISIIARGPRDVNETRAFIQDYLDSKGDTYKFSLSPMMEPLGWSYNATGKIVDDSGNPVSGTSVQVVYQDYNKEYRTFASPKTGSDGVFVLPRVFAGTSILKVYANEDSSQSALTVNWTNPTNTTINLGTYTVAKKQNLNFGSYTLSISPVETSSGNLKVQHSGQKLIITRTVGTITHSAEISWVNPPSGIIEISEGKEFMKQTLSFMFKKTSSGSNSSFDGCEVFVNAIDPTSGWFNDWQNSNLPTLGFSSSSVRQSIPASTITNSASANIDIPVVMSLTNTGGPEVNIDGKIVFSGSINNFGSSGYYVPFSLTFTYKN